MTATPSLEDITRLDDSHDVIFPEVATRVDQDEEWFEFDVDGETKRLGMHDYAAIYEVPGLYESLVYHALKCRSPLRVVRPLIDLVRSRGVELSDLRVLDLGAGNGVVGELLRRHGVESQIGVDILPEAAAAARRDRPDAYEEFVVTDLTAPTEDEEQRLRAFAPNCLVSVAALGFGDIPPEAFVRAFNYIPPNGWMALCIKERFLDHDDDNGFGRLVRRLLADGSVDLLHRERYVHRLSIAGSELHYVVLIARKVRNHELAT